jgi:hypothetical protein
MNELLLLGLGLFILSRVRKKDDEAPDNTTPDVVPFTASNVNAYKNLNTTSVFDSRLAKEARRVTPDGTGKNIVDGTYKCFAPGNQSRRAAIIKIYEDLDRLQTSINNSTGTRREEYRKDRREKDNERAILVAEHYMLCEAFFEELKKKAAAGATGQTQITTAVNVRQAP